MSGGTRRRPRVVAGLVPAIRGGTAPLLMAGTRPATTMCWQASLMMARPTGLEPVTHSLEGLHFCRSKSLV